jgi:hypothetical protein
LPQLDDLAINGVEALYALLNGREIQTESAGSEVKAVIAGEPAKNFFHLVTDQDGVYGLRHDQETRFAFLGQELEIGLVSHHLTHMRLGSDPAELRPHHGDGDEAIPVSFVRPEGSKLVLRVPSDLNSSISGDGLMMVERNGTAS